MRKINLLIVGLIAAFIVSCNQSGKNRNGFPGNRKTSYGFESERYDTGVRSH